MDDHLITILVSIALVLILFCLYATFCCQSPQPQSGTQSYSDTYWSSYNQDTYHSTYHSGHSYTEGSSLTNAPESNIGYSPPSTTISEGPKRSSRFRNIQNVLSRPQLKTRTAGETSTGTRRMKVATLVRSTLRQKFAKRKDSRLLKRIFKKGTPGDGSVGPVGEKECVVCTEVKAAAAFPEQLTPRCRHTTDICRICIDRWIAIQMEQSKAPIQCIDQDCQEHLDHKDIRVLMKEDTLQRCVYLVRLCHWLAYLVINCHAQIRQSPQEYGTGRLA
jgi:hypothetical protein